MKDLEKYTVEIKNRGQKALVPFFTAFYPTPDKFAALLLAAQSAGADAIEIGLPFSDPVADGKFIQYSSEWVLNRSFKLRDFMHFYKEIRKDLRVPTIIMSYLNPVYYYGIKKFADFMQDQKVAGILFPDLPLEEIEVVKDYFAQKNIALVLMVAPSTNSARLTKIASASRGFIYLVSIYGVTGMESKADEVIFQKSLQLREITDKPVYAGFGIYTPSQANKIARQVDGIIVGSALIKLIKGRESRFEVNEIKHFLEEFRRTL